MIWAILRQSPRFAQMDTCVVSWELETGKYERRADSTGVWCFQRSCAMIDKRPVGPILVGQGQRSSHVPFAGCYRVISLTWSPADHTITLIPQQFELLTDAIPQAKDIFQIRTLPATDDLMQNGWIWQPKDNRIWISWGRGFGGFRGTMKLSRSGDWAGKLKEWCDSHCEYKKRVGVIRIRKIACSK